VCFSFCLNKKKQKFKTEKSRHTGCAASFSAIANARFHKFNPALQTKSLFADLFWKHHFYTNVLIYILFSKAGYFKKAMPEIQELKKTAFIVQ